MLKKLKDKLMPKKDSKEESSEESVKTEVSNTDNVPEKKEVLKDETLEDTKKTKKSKNSSSDKINREDPRISLKKDTFMGRLWAGIKIPPTIGDVVEGPVIGIEKSAVFIDLAPFGTGIIYGREFNSARDIIKNINIGDSIAAKVVDLAHPDGYFELSLKEARQALIWSEADDAIKNRSLLELPVVEANKGGLIIVWQGIHGFLPASQLKPEHYPLVQDGDKDKILDELKRLVGQKITVSIISANPKEGKLIFSEKNPENKDKEKMTGKYKIGDELVGTVTGIVDFGAFVKIEEGLEGLVHISEIDWSLVEDPRLFVKIGQEVKVKVIEIKDGKVSLSMKALKTNPWVLAKEKYKKEDLVDGVIIKYNRHGALASIEEGVAGLVHVSEFGSEEKLRGTLELGKSYKFKISLFDPKEQKMALSFPEKDKTISKDSAKK